MFYSRQFNDFAAAAAIETFRPIEGFEQYEVSNLGRVLSHMGKFPKMLKGTVTTLGYVEVMLHRDGKAFHRYIHRLVLAAFEGPCPELHEVRHLDGQRTNCRLSNLAYGTSRENSHDKKRHATDRPRARLTPDEVRDILTSAMRGEKTRETSARLAIPPYVVSDVRTGYTYRDLAPELPRRLSKMRKSV